MAELVAVAKGAGRVHLAWPADRGAFEAACWRRVQGVGVESYPGRHCLKAWRLGPRCADCEHALRGRSVRAFVRATAWGVNR